MSWDTEIAADSPILWWKFDEVSGSVVDHSVNSNFGTVFGGVTREQAGILGAGSAYNLSLTGSVYCVMPSQLSSATAFSMECLFRRTGGDNIAVVQPKGAAMQGPGPNGGGAGMWARDPEGDIVFWAAQGAGGVGASITASGATVDAGWHHLVGTNDGTTLRLYIDGVEAVNAPITGVSFANSTSYTGPLPAGFYVGRHHDRNNSGFDPDLFFPGAAGGDHDDVILYDTALSPARVAAHAAEALGSAGETLTPTAQISLDNRPICSPRAPIQLAITEALTPAAQIRLATNEYTPAAQIRLATAETLTPSAGIRLQTTSQALADAISGYVTIRATIAGSDVSAQLRGSADIDVEYEEDASGLAEFTIDPPAGAFLLPDYVAKPVTLKAQILDAAGAVQFEQDVYSGYISDPSYDPDTGALLLSCTTDLPGALDAASRDEIDAITPEAVWSPHVFEEGAQGFAYARDRMRTRAASMWHSPGGIVVTDWAAKATADLELDDSQVVTGSIRYSTATRRDLLNEIHITADYRFDRMRQRTLACRFSMTQTFCELLINGFNICQRGQIESAANGGGWYLQGDIDFEDLPPAGTYRCFPFAFGPSGAKYIGWGRLYLGYLLDDPDWNQLCWGASWKVARRWAQKITERHEIIVKAPQSQAGNGKIATRESYALESDQDISDWLNDENFQGTGDKPGFQAIGNSFTSGDYTLGDAGRDATDDEATGRDAADLMREVAIKAAKADELQAHRQNSVTFLSTYQPLINLTKTVRLNCDGFVTKGKVRRYRHRFSLELGRAETECELAISRHFGSGLVSSSPVAPDDPPEKPVETDIPTRKKLGSHVGGLTTTVALPDDAEGYMTNYQFDFTDTDPFAAEPNSPAAIFYPETFVCRYPEISGAALDAIELPATQVVEVEIPEDELTITH